MLAFSGQMVSQVLSSLTLQGRGGNDPPLMSSWLSAITDRPLGAISTIDSTVGESPSTSQPGGPPMNRNSKPLASRFVRHGLFVGFPYMHRAG